jgi:type II secretory pathway predicted ATPase ExeA
MKFADESYSRDSNPFNFSIIPELFVGYTDEVKNVVNSLNNGDKFIVLLGPTGSGKTTFLKYLMKKFKQDRIIYVSKPPKNSNEIIDIFTGNMGLGFFERFSRKKLTLYNLPEWVNKKAGSKKTIMFVDEAHEASLETLEWLRTLTDHVENLSILLSGLPTLEGILKNNLETFMKRVSTRVELVKLNLTETRELIKRRVEWAGGEDVKPFTFEAIKSIYERSGGFPREVIRTCDELVKKAAEKNITTIDSDFIGEDVRSLSKVSINTLNSMPQRQRHVLEVLSKHGELAPNKIISHMKVEDYKDKDNAIRSVNNILKRLMADGLVIRKKSGKMYYYRISDKIKTMFVST